MTVGKNLGACIVWASLTCLACNGDHVSPTAPSPPAAQEIRLAVDVAGSPVTQEASAVVGARMRVDDDAELKIKVSPVPVDPVDGVEIDGFTPVLTARSAQGFVDGINLGYHFKIYRMSSNDLEEVESGYDSRHDSSPPSYQVKGSLNVGGSYAWHVRPFFEVGDVDKYGPWSGYAFFKTIAARLGAPRLISPINEAVVGRRPLFQMRNGTVEGAVAALHVEIQVALDANFGDSRVAKKVPAGDQGVTEFQLDEDLMLATSYHWRARAAASTGASRRFESPWSSTASFRTATVRAPTLISPGNREEVDLNPIFEVRSDAIADDIGTVYINVQVSTNEDFADIVGDQRVRMEGNTTNLRLKNSLMPETSYFWRARVVATISPSDTVASSWSARATFRTESLWPPPPRGGHPPNMLHVVQRIAREHPEKLQASWDRANRRWIESRKEFLDLVIDALRDVDPRWAYNCVRGNCNRVSIDGAAYYRGAGTERNAQNSTDVAIIDFLAGQADGSTPRPSWYDITEEARRHNTIGRWRYPRPGR